MVNPAKVLSENFTLSRFLLDPLKKNAQKEPKESSTASAKDYSKVVCYLSSDYSSDYCLNSSARLETEG